MEVVHVVGFFPPHLGGQESVVEQLAALQADRHRVTVYTSSIGAGHAPRLEQRPGRAGTLRLVRLRAAMVLNVPVMPALPVRLLRHTPKPDVLHVHTGQVLLAEVAAFVARLRGIPYVLHQHLLLRPSTRFGRVLLPAYLRLPYARVLRRADRVICLTRTMGDAVATSFGVDPGRIVVIPNGVDPAMFHPGARPRRPAEVLFVGRLAPQKNLAALLEAVAILRDRGREVRIRLIGDGEERDSLRSLAAARRLSNVHFDGRLSRTEVAQALRAATLAVIPSTHEGLPLALLEAMASGTPVVSFALPEIVEIGGDAVLLARPGAADDLANALARLLDDGELRRRLSAAGLARAGDFAWSAVTDAVDEVYAGIRGERMHGAEASIHDR